MPPLNPKDYEIAWIAPLPIEAKAALEMLDERHAGRFAMDRGDDYVFVPGKMCGLNVIIATLPAGKEYGTESAAALASQVKKTFTQLLFGLLVGMAAGLPNLSASKPRDIRLGDVLVALPYGNTDGVIAYQLGRETKDGFQLLRDGHVLSTTADNVRSIIGKIRLDAPNETRLFLPYYENIKNNEHEDGDFSDPGQESDVLYEINEFKVKKVVTRTKRPNAKRTRVWYGPIGSGDTLMKFGITKNEFRDRFDIIGLEMEAAGTMNVIPVGVIRGVCDYGDQHKNKAWQPYAAAMAAAYAKAVLAEVGRDCEVSNGHEPSLDVDGGSGLPKYRTFRVRNVPSGETQQSLKGLLSDTEPYLGPSVKIHVFSLARDLSSFETTKTATVRFEYDDLPLWLKAGNNWTLKTRDGCHTILLDTHFFGFTALNDVHQDEDVLDCIFVHGLNGHPLGSWADGNFTWVRDDLPGGAKGARSILYGYDTDLITAEALQSIEDVAATLVAQLETMERPLNPRPVIFFAHSLGGVVLKSALRLLARNRDALLRSVREVMFFGVPNQGMEISLLRPLIKGQPTDCFVSQLARGSAYLQNLDRQFAGLSTYMKNLHSSTPARLVSFYETRQSETAEYNTPTSQWDNSGPRAVLLAAESAIQTGSNEQDRYPIDDTHSNMVKLAPGNPVYEIIRRHVVEQIQIETSGTLHQGATTQPGRRLVTELNSESDNDRDVIVKVTQSLTVWRLEISHRFDSIKLPYDGTFSWIWHNNSPFLSWLKSAHRIFWVSGKPGSGKSMLMKYISHTYKEMTSQLFPEASNPPIHVSSSFYDPGTEIQKSIEGLLYTILSQCIDSEQGLVRYITPAHKKCKGTWTIAHLREALDTILRQNEISVSLILFLDALDECKEPASVIVDFVDHLVDSSRHSAVQIRICLSSRPYNTFLDAFESFPGLKIQDHTMTDVLTYITGRFRDNRRMSLLLARDCEAKKQVGPDLIEALKDRAEGVFLWLRLTIDELLEECRDTAGNISDLLDTLQFLSPKPELEEKYKRILQKIPPKFRQDAYIMLEIALRSDGPVSCYDFWLAVSCAKHNNLARCIDEIPTKPWLTQEGDEGEQDLSDEFDVPPGTRICDLYGTELELTPPADSQDRRLSSRCGSLLERRRNEIHGEVIYSIEFLHRTVKEFAQNTGLSDLRTDHPSFFNENGYIFLSKYGLAQLAVERKRRHTPFYQSLPCFMTERSTWFSFLHYFSRAEASTGVSQKHLLDEAENENAFAPAQGENDVYGLYGSALTFGAVTNLLLYVEESLRNDDPAFVAEVLGLQKSNNSTLLHDVARRRLDRCSYTPLQTCPKVARTLVTPNIFSRGVTFENLTQMATLLLAFGASRTNVHNAHTPFQLLLANPFKGYGGGYVFPELIAMVQLFLNDGQDPDTDVPAQDCTVSVAGIVAKPLHLANPQLASILLRHKANVNALDSTGLTPLDVAFGAVGNIFENGDYTRLKRAYNLVMLLLRHGGRVTSAGLAALSNFHKALESMGYAIKDLDPRIRDPPRLDELFLILMDQGGQVVVNNVPRHLTPHPVPVDAASDPDECQSDGEITTTNSVE